MYATVHIPLVFLRERSVQQTLSFFPFTGEMTHFTPQANPGHNIVE